MKLSSLTDQETPPTVPPNKPGGDGSKILPFRTAGQKMVLAGASKKKKGQVG